MITGALFWLRVHTRYKHMTWLGGECVDLGNDAWSEATVEIRSPLGERGRHTSIFSRCEQTSRFTGSALHTRPIAFASSHTPLVIPSGTSPYFCPVTARHLNLKFPSNHDILINCLISLLVRQALIKAGYPISPRLQADSPEQLFPH